MYSFLIKFRQLKGKRNLFFLSLFSSLFIKILKCARVMSFLCSTTVIDNYLKLINKRIKNYVIN